MTSKSLPNFYQKWVEFIYNTLMIVLLPWMLMRLLFKARSEPAYRKKIWERVGWYSKSSESNSKYESESEFWIWIHAVSLGEMRVAALLMEAMRQRDPQLRFLLTHSTATGLQEGSKCLTDRDLQVWYPWDVSWCVKSFVSHFKPWFGVLIETEVWPNMVKACQWSQTPLVLVNARMSDKSFKAASKLSVLAKPAYEGLRAVWTQGAADAQRLSALGANVQGILGSMKFDAAPDATLMALGEKWKTHREQLMVLLASSRPGEEELFLHAINQLPNDLQAKHLWAIVPRHPQRFDEVVTLGKRMGFECFRRSHWVSLEHMQDVFARRPSAKTLFIGDSLGEMNFYYASAQVCLMGASFLPFGGQNLIEPMACSCPVVIGPYTYNFEKIAVQAKEQHAALGVQNMALGISAAIEVLNDKELQKRVLSSALKFVQSQQGATQKTVLSIWTLIDQAVSE